MFKDQIIETSYNQDALGTIVSYFNETSSSKIWGTLMYIALKINYN